MRRIRRHIDKEAKVKGTKPVGIKLVLAVAAVAVLTLAVPQAIAVLSTNTANLGAQRLVTVTEGAAHEKVCVTSAECANAFTPLPGASATIAVPSGQTARLVARFSGESDCWAPAGCSLRIMVDGVQMLPASGNNFAFDSGGNFDGDQDSYESLAMDRTSRVVSAGTHTVRVDWAVNNPNAGFWLDDWQLTVESWRVS